MTPEQGKLLSQVFINTIQNETETTKKVIRAIPEDKKSYKPDPKSMSANDLAWHIATPEELAWRAGDVFRWIAEGKLELRIDTEYPLAEAPQAHRDLEARKTTGKIILRV